MVSSSPVTCPRLPEPGEAEGKRAVVNREDHFHKGSGKNSEQEFKIVRENRYQLKARIFTCQKPSSVKFSLLIPFQKTIQGISAKLYEQLALVHLLGKSVKD